MKVTEKQPKINVDQLERILAFRQIAEILINIWIMTRYILLSFYKKKLQIF